MPNTSIGGLVSGLDTASIISQLMLLEARPQTMLKSRVSMDEKVVNALQTLNAKIASVATKAADIAALSNWAGMSATSSTDRVTVAADPSATPTSLTFDVVSTATASGALYADQGTADTPLVAADTVITVSYANSGREPATSTFDTGTGSLADIAAAINDPANATGLRATLLKTGGTADAPTYRLHVVSAATGLDSGFTIGDGTFLGGISSSTPGSDASISIGGQNFSFSTNRIADLMPGVDVTLLAESEGKSVTITVAKDVESLAGKVKGLIDTVNFALTELSSLTASGADAKSRGILAGDTTLRSARSQLIESVSRGLGGESLATVGIQVDRYGKLTFDESTFKAAYAAEPAGVQALIAGTDPASGADTGFADKLAALGKALSDSNNGTVSLAIKSRQSAIRGMQDDIADWDVRLATRQTALQRQYTALETALGKLQSQSSWLAGQIASLPQMSSGQ